jgi:hypothetical protein
VIRARPTSRRASAAWVCQLVNSVFLFSSQTPQNQASGEDLARFGPAHVRPTDAPNAFPSISCGHTDQRNKRTAPGTDQKRHSLGKSCGAARIASRHVSQPDDLAASTIRPSFHRPAGAGGKLP